MTAKAVAALPHLTPKTYTTVLPIRASRYINHKLLLLIRASPTIRVSLIQGELQGKHAVTKYILINFHNAVNASKHKNIVLSWTDMGMTHSKTLLNSGRS